MKHIFAVFLRVSLVAIGLSFVATVFGAQIHDAYRQPLSEWPPFEIDESVDAQELGPLPRIPAVDWHTSGSENLGRKLFFDPRLSGSGQIACASCHDSNLGWTDGRRFAFGHDRTSGTRNAMTLLNVAFFDRLFWDGRADGLLELMLQPIQSPTEMNASIEEVVANIAPIEEYQQQFQEVFESPDITAQNIGIALASFVRSIVSSRSRFDRFAEGEYDALTNEQIHGLHLFRTKARCMNCHHGPLFSDGEFHHTGLSYYGRRFEDLGRFNATGIKGDRGKFKTPSLRDLMHTGPWMHNGLFTSFTGILRMYNHGVTFNSRVQRKTNAPPLSPLIKPLGLSKSEVAALEDFLKSLSRIPRFVEPPELPRTIGKPESSFVSPLDPSPRLGNENQLEALND